MYVFQVDVNWGFNPYPWSSGISRQPNPRGLENFLTVKVMWNDEALS